MVHRLTLNEAEQHESNVSTAGLSQSQPTTASQLADKTYLTSALKKAGATSAWPTAKLKAWLAADSRFTPDEQNTQPGLDESTKVTVIAYAMRQLVVSRSDLSGELPVKAITQ